MSTLDSHEGAGAWVVTALTVDGQAAREVALAEDPLEIGRGGCALDFPDDEAMAERHVRLRLQGEAEAAQSVELEDLGTGSGVWLRLTGSDGEPVRDRDQFWLGAQILVLRRSEQDSAAVGTDSGWQVHHHGPDGKHRATHEIPASGLLIGRASEWALDPEDALLSRRHLQLAFQEGELFVFDRGAHNGSFRKLRGRESIEAGQEFRAASQRFRLDRRVMPAEVGAAIPSTGEDDSRPRSAAHASASATPAARPGPAVGLGARLRSLGRPQPEPEPEVAAVAVAPSNSSAPPDPPAEDESERTVVSLPPVDSAPDAAPDAAVLDTESEPKSPEAAQEGSRVLVVIDSAAGSVALEVEPGTTVLEGVQAAGLERGQPVDWECGDGGCGVCIVGVVEGADRMDPPDPATGEMKTIQITEQVAPDPRQYRLACLAKVRGTVRLRKLT